MDRGVQDVDDVRRTQRVAAFAVLTDTAGRVVLARGSDRGHLPGLWSLPGGGVDFGEHPRDAVVREFGEETGLAVRVTGLREVRADVLPLPYRSELQHNVRVVYDVEPLDDGWSGMLRREPDGTTDDVRLVGPDEDVPLLPFTAAVLGRPVPPMPVGTPPARPLPPSDPARLAEPADPSDPAGPVDGGPVETADAAPRLSAALAARVAEGGAPATADDAAALQDVPPVRLQRPAAYALCHDDGRVLLTRLRNSRLWTLPGGGIDHGEEPAVAAVREVHEETGLDVVLRDLLDIDSVRFTGRGPTGRIEDFHGIRIVYDGIVPADVAPRVVEVGGSTVEAAWVSVQDVHAGTLEPTGLVRAALQHLR